MLRFWILVQVIVQITITSPTEYEACGGKPADIVFILDSSASIIDSDYQKMLRFTKEIVNNFDIGREKTKVGLLTFSDTVYPKFDLETYDNKGDILQRIGQVGKENGGTNTADALNYARIKAFSGVEEGQGVPHIVIVLTDGQSQDIERTKVESTLAHQEGIVIFVIGIGNQVDDAELSAIASKPVEKYKFTVNSFDALDSIKRELSIKACAVPPATKPPIVQQMVSDSDILYGGVACAPMVPVSVAFAVDTAEIGITNAKFVLQFIRNVAERLKMDSQKMSISALTNGCGDNPDILIDSAFSKDSVKTDIDSIHGPKGVSTLMQKMRHKLTNRQNSGMSRVGILFIGDNIERKDLREAIRERKRATFQNVEIFVIGVGDRVSQTDAAKLTTERNHYLYTERYETLSQLEGPMLLQLCTLQPPRD